MRRLLTAAIAVVALLCTSLLLVPSAQATFIGNGRVRVTLQTPAGVPATAVLSPLIGDGFVASKAPDGTSSTVELTVPAGTYTLRADPVVTVDGDYYVPVLGTLPVLVNTLIPASVTVTYKPYTYVRDLHVTRVAADSVALAWTAEPGVSVTVLRGRNGKPPSSILDGTAVPVSGSTATDTGLTPGTDYVYGLFVRKFLVWDGPFTLAVGTASPDGAAYAANPQTRFIEQDQVTTAIGTGNRLRLQLKAGAPYAGLGTPMIVGASAALPGGFVGVVDAVSADGRTVDLRFAGLEAAMDYWKASIDLGTSTPAANGRVTAQSALPRPENSCNDTTAGAALNLDTDLDFDGRFNGTINKYAGVPRGATVEVGMDFSFTTTGSMTASAGVICALKFTPITRTYKAARVPLALVVEPILEVEFQAAGEFDNVNVTGTSGFTARATFGVGGEQSASADTNHSLDVKNIHGSNASQSANLRFGTEILFGPGVASSKAGAVAAVRGDVNLLEGEIAMVTADVSPCLQFDARAGFALLLEGRAWIGSHEFSAPLEIDELNRKVHIDGYPVYFPRNCDREASTDPSNPIYGNGIQVLNASYTGSPGQRARLNGLTPGRTAQVFSTGVAQQAVTDDDGVPNTNMHTPGDSDIADLFGYDTYDAAGYTATVVPAGDTLHVRYAFASSEYPVWVGKASDRMAVLVNGVNCALVPGTNDPVSIQTINDQTNARYFVDNEPPAAGYNSTMAMLTTPLDCSVRVTPGSEVSVKIVVADTTDEQLDSAVAVLDGGIWSD